MKKLTLIIVIVFIGMIIQAQDINIGMSTSQVKQLLGKPSRTDITPYSDSTVKTVYIYSEELDYYYLEFFNDKIVNINPHPTNYKYPVKPRQTTNNNSNNSRHYTSLPRFKEPNTEGRAIIIIAKTLFIVGIASMGAGYVMISDESKVELQDTGTILLGAGAIMYTMSIPLWISGVERKHKNHIHYR